MSIWSAHFKREYNLGQAEQIGAGNFAKVYRVFDSELNESLAIRVISKIGADKEDLAKEKTINEQLRKVQSENILRIYDIIDSKDSVCYITEYCSGGSLWDVLNDCKDCRMNEKQGIQCVLQISKGVQELHNHSITHRDLKPENILLKTKPIPGRALPLVKLADFGLSTQKIIMQTIAGTKEYLAPEQAKFQNYTNAVDIWSLGIICDEILHGTPFYTGENNKEVFDKILKEPYRVRNESLRSSIKELLMSILKKKPYERPIIAVIRSKIEGILREIEEQHPVKGRGKSTNGAYNGNMSRKNTPFLEGLSKSNAHPEEGGGVFIRSVGSKLFDTLSTKEIAVPLKRENVLLVRNHVSRPDSAIGDSQSASNLYLRLRESSLQAKIVERHPPVNSGDHLFNLESKSNIPSAIKPAEKSQDYLTLEEYALKVQARKKAICDVTLTVQKQQIFMPNAHLRSSDFVAEENSTQADICKLKSKYHFLNSFAVDEDYEAALLTGRAQLKINSEECRLAMQARLKQISEVFFKQIDSIVDHYIERSLK